MTKTNDAFATPPREFSNKFKLIVLFGFAFLFIIIGLFTTDSIAGLKDKIVIILTHPSRTDFDSFFWTGELGAPFVQAGLSMLMVLIVYALVGTKITGPSIAAFGMVVGFSFYGKNILSMCFTLAGVFLHAIIFKKKLADAAPLGFFLGCLGPFFSFNAFGHEALGPGSAKAFIIGVVLAVAASFLAAIFAEYFPKLHGGYLLFNAGLAGGCAATIMASMLKIIGLGIDQPNYGDSYLADKNLSLTLLLAITFLYLIIVGLLTGGLAGFQKLFWNKNEFGNHVDKFGFSACLINMGVMGFLGVAYVWLLGGDINGAIFAGIWANAAFSANGSTVRNQLPVITGILLAGMLTGGLSAVITGSGSFMAGGLAKIATRGLLLCALFSCGVAPIVGRFGFLAGAMVGFVHIIVVPNISPLHGWMLLYNNGFSLGLIAVLLYPLYSKWFIYKDKVNSVPEGLPK